MVYDTPSLLGTFDQLCCCQCRMKFTSLTHTVWFIYLPGVAFPSLIYCMCHGCRGWCSPRHKAWLEKSRGGRIGTEPIVDCLTESFITYLWFVFRTVTMGKQGVLDCFYTPRSSGRLSLLCLFHKEHRLDVLTSYECVRLCGCVCECVRLCVVYFLLLFFFFFF